MFACEKWSRQSWSICTSFSNSAWKSSTGSFGIFSVAASNLTSSGGSARSADFQRSPSSLSAGFFAQFRVLIRDFFEHGVLLQFRLDERLEFERRRLQQRQRLLELRRQHQRLRQSLRKL